MMLELREYIEAKSTTISNLLLTYYKKIGLDELEVMMYIQLARFDQQGNYFPEIVQIAKVMSISEERCFQLIQSLLEKQIINIVTLNNDMNKTEDKYDLTPVYDKISHVMEQEKEIELEVAKKDDKTSLFYRFEEEFGRPLSPIELETIQAWLDEDDYSVELITLALREAILNQAYSLKYIDRILLSWEKKNLKTSRDIQLDQKKRLNQIDEKSEQTSTEEVLPKIPMFDWLNSNES